MLNRQSFQIIQALSHGPKSYWELMGAIHGTIADSLTNLTALLEAQAIAHVDGKFRLITAVYDAVVRDDLDRIMASFQEVSRRRPGIEQQFYQGNISDADTLKRLRYIHARGDLAHKRFFLLGDYDLFSIALAMTGLPARVVVAELDERVVQHIATSAEQYNLPIELLRYNCADQLPTQLHQQFDVFICDPIETESGIVTWLSRGLTALRHPGALYFGLTEIECSANIWHTIQRALTRMNMVCTDILPKFSYYPEENYDYRETPLLQTAPVPLRDPDVMWYHSSYVRAETIDTPAPMVTGPVVFDQDFYRSPFSMTLSTDAW
jgi:hypothetical protein